MEHRHGDTTISRLAIACFPLAFLPRPCSPLACPPLALLLPCARLRRVFKATSARQDPDAVLFSASPFTNGLKGWVSSGTYIDAFTSAEWDDQNEVLKVVVTAVQSAGSVQGMYLDSSMLPHGLGPLPPSGGIDAKWYKGAHVRRFSAGDCTGGSSNRPGFGAEVCDTSVIVGGQADTILFDSSTEVMAKRANLCMLT